MLFLVIKAMIVVGLIRYLEDSGEPLQCALIYTGGALLGSLVFGASLGAILGMSLVRLGLSAMYFYALHYIAGGPLFWLVAVVGFLFVLV